MPPTEASEYRWCASARAARPKASGRKTVDVFLRGRRLAVVGIDRENLMTGETAAGAEPRLGALDRVLRIFSDVRAGEGATVLLMFANLLLLLFSYYVIRKTVRDAD